MSHNAPEIVQDTIEKVSFCYNFEKMRSYILINVSVLNMVIQANKTWFWPLISIMTYVIIKHYSLLNGSKWTFSINLTSVWRILPTCYTIWIKCYCKRYHNAWYETKYTIFTRNRKKFLPMHLNVQKQDIDRVILKLKKKIVACCNAILVELFFKSFWQTIR